MRRGVPSFFGTTTMREHHTVGVPGGTGSMMPRRTSRSKSALTFDFQWWGTGIGVWWATGLTSGLK